jgi:hypothetical protein
VGFTDGSDNAEDKPLKRELAASVLESGCRARDAKLQ